MAVLFDPPQSSQQKKCDVKYFTRHGEEYAAIYNKDGKLIILERLSTPHRSGAEIPRDSQTFKRFADGNRGNKFTPAD